MEKCTVCNKQFQPKRANQVFCSKACKQKSFRDKSAVSTVAQPKQSFSYSEWRSMVEWFDMDVERYPFLIFCFLRGLAPASLTGEDLYVAMGDLAGDWDKLYQLTNTKAYEEFRERFFKKEFDIVV